MVVFAVPVIAAPLSKAQEIARIDRSITASMVQSNPDKYVGRYVEFDCVVANVVKNRRVFANATCTDGNRANIVLVGDRVRQLHYRQSLTIIGQVIVPVEGKNMFGAAFGGSTRFATVRFDWKTANRSHWHRTLARCASRVRRLPCAFEPLEAA